MTTANTIKRSELYQLVWLEPMARLAKKFALSDVGLAKICRKHQIPCPPRGYWAKKQHGQEPPLIELPELDQDSDIELRDPSTNPQAPPVSEQSAQKIAAERDPSLRVEMGDSLRGAHELVSRAKHDIQLARIDKTGFASLSDTCPLKIVASRTNVRRSLLIMDAILKALVKRSYEVKAGPTVKIEGFWIGFMIQEDIETIREPNEDPNLDGQYSFRFNRVNTRVVPSGQLELSITYEREYCLTGCRRHWRDTEKHKIEDRLNQFIASLIETADRLKQQKEKEQKQQELRRQEELQWQEKQRLLNEKRMQHRAEKVRFDTLLQHAENYRKSKEIRELIEAVKIAHSQAGPISPDSDIAKWMNWASQQADRLDPIRPSPPSILDEDIPPEEERPRSNYSRW